MLACSSHEATTNQVGKHDAFILQNQVYLWSHIDTKGHYSISFKHEAPIKLAIGAAITHKGKFIQQIAKRINSNETSTKTAWCECLDIAPKNQRLQSAKHIHILAYIPACVHILISSGNDANTKTYLANTSRYYLATPSQINRMSCNMFHGCVYLHQSGSDRDSSVNVMKYT